MSLPSHTGLIFVFRLDQLAGETISEIMRFSFTFIVVDDDDNDFLK